MAGKAKTVWVSDTKPDIGDTTTGAQIGVKSRGVFCWVACPDCGCERWIGRNQKTRLCMSCAAIRRNLVGKRNPRWNGGVRQDEDGYRYISVAENHPLIAMAGRVFVHNRYRYNIAEHRLVMAQHLGRPLDKWELVHHLNGNKGDNRVENLELLQHAKEHLPSMSVQRTVSDLEKRVSVLEKRVTILEAENAVLRSLLEDGGRDNVPDTLETKTL